MTVSVFSRAALLSLMLPLAMVSCITPPPDGGSPPSDEVADEETDRPTAVGADWRLPDAEQPGQDPAQGDGEEPAVVCEPLDCSGFCGLIEDSCGQRADCGVCGEVASLQLATVSTVVLSGESFSVEVQALDTQGNVILAPAVAWSSDDDTVVTVGADGDGAAILRGMREGSTKVTAQLGELAAELEIEVEDGFVDVAAGSAHTCALTESGRAYCWGEGAALGADGGVAAGLRRVDTEQSFVEISAGREHTCAIGADRMTVFCWGSNVEQQLAGFAGQSATSPVPVVIPGAAPYSGLVAGGGQTCLEADEQPYCWGGTSAAAPTAGYAGLKSLALGEDFGCGVESGTDVTCWGPATASMPSGEPMSSLRIPKGDDDDDELLRIGELVAGAAHTCALGEDDRVYCWGSNEHGQVKPDEDDSRIDGPSRVNWTSYLGLAAGPTSTCAWKKDDKEVVDCWGEAVEDARMPHDVEQLTVGASHACARLSDDSVWCWGENDGGQLGNGSTVAPLGPVAVLPEAG